MPGLLFRELHAMFSGINTMIYQYFKINIIYVNINKFLHGHP